jgi:HD-like signal output (HDOD) protein/ActR/RegA family two-component response regulator
MHAETQPIDLDALKAAGTLPTPKGIALTVMKLCQKENVSLADLAHTIQADPALAGRIIRIANIVNPNKSRPIASVTTDTLILIGIQAVRQVVLGFSLVSSYQDGPCRNFDYKRFWSRSLVVATAAQALAAATRLAPPAELFTCGILGDVGRLALATARPEEYAQILAQGAELSSAELAQCEAARFGLEHRDLTTYLLHDWGIPKLFIDALYHHEQPEDSGLPDGSRCRRLAYLLNMATLIADVCMQSEAARQEVVPRLYTMGNTLGLDAERIARLTDEAVRDWREWGNMLHIRTHAVQPLTETRPDDGKGAAAPALPPMRILVVDDDETLIFMLSRLLSQAGHEVRTAPDAKRAMEQLATALPDVVIADWNLPDGDGLALCRAIRTMPGGNLIYVVMLTEMGEERREIDALETGVNDYLRKPLNPKLFMARLMAARRYVDLALRAEPG